MKGLQVRTPEEMDALRARVRERLALYREAKDLLAEPLREYGSVDDLFAAVDRHAEERNGAEKQVSLADAYPVLTEFVRDQVQDAEQLTLGGMIAALGGMPAGAVCDLRIPMHSAPPIPVSNRPSF